MAVTAETAPSENLARTGTAGLFATTVSSYRWPETDALNADLRRTILERETTGPATVRSNMGGWHAASDLLRWEDAAIQTFRGMLHRYAADIMHLTAIGKSDKQIGLTIEA